MFNSPDFDLIDVDVEQLCGSDIIKSHVKELMDYTKHLEKLWVDYRGEEIIRLKKDDLLWSPRTHGSFRIEGVFLLSSLVQWINPRVSWYLRIWRWLFQRKCCVCGCGVKSGDKLILEYKLDEGAD